MDCGCKKKPSPRKKMWIDEDENPDSFIKDVLDFEDNISSKKPEKKKMIDKIKKNIRRGQINPDASFNSSFFFDSLDIDNIDYDTDENGDITIISKLRSLV